MDQDYLDDESPTSEFLQNLDITLQQKEALEPFFKDKTYLSIIQSSLINLFAQQKSKILIESPLKNGKTISLFIYLIQQICQFEQTEQKNSPIITLIYPHQVFFQQIEKFIIQLKAFFELMPVDLIALQKPSLNIISKQKKNTLRIIVGTISEVINCFRQENLQAKDLSSLLIDDLDQLLSFGQFNNLKRFTNFCKNQDSLENKNLIFTLKEEYLTEIQSFKDLIEEKFVNIRIKMDFEEELQNYEQEMEVEDDQPLEQTSLFNQYYYINTTENLYSLLFLISKFEVFTQNFLIISDTIEQAYANKLFIERMSLAEKALVYNPQHPIALKSYRISLFNNNTTKFLCAPKNILKEMQKNKEVKPLKNFRNIIFSNCNLSKSDFLSFRDLVSQKMNLANLEKINDYNFLFLIKKSEENDKNEEEENLYQKSFYNLLSKLKEDNLNSEFQPVPVDNKDISLYNYRTQQVLETLSKNCIKLFRLIEIKKLMLKSKKMKEYFKKHEKERNLLLHQLNKYCKQFEKTKMKISDHIPDYLKPSFVKEKEKMDKVQYLMKKNKLRSELSRRTLQRENPLITEPSRLRTFSSHKLWKIKHKKIKKRPNKKKVRKGTYNPNQISQ